MITQPPAVVEPPDTKKNPRNYSYTAPVVTSNYTDEELKKMVDKMLTTKKSPDLEAIPAMKQYVEGQMREAVLAQRYDYGAKMELADEMMNQFLECDDTAAQKEKIRKEAEDKLLETKGRMEELKREYEERLSKLKSDQNNRIMELENEHQKQVDEFEKKWADPNFTSQFNKPSQRLLNLRQIEQTLAIAKLFDRAKEVKLQADELQKRDVEEARRTAVVSMRKEFEVLDQKQKREMECLLQYAKRNVENLEMERDKRIRPLEQIVQRLTPIAYPKKVPDRKKNFYQEIAEPPTPRPIRNMQQARTVSARGPTMTGIRMRRYIKTDKGSTSPRNTKRSKPSKS